MESEHADHLRTLEERLLQPDVRRSAQAVASLLADEFVEFGSSGRVFDKTQIITALRDEPPIERVLSDFAEHRTRARRGAGNVPDSAADCL